MLRRHWLVCTSVALLLSAAGAPQASLAQDAGTTLIQVSFSTVNSIQTGDLASYSNESQRIRFEVDAREVRVTQTEELLWTGEANIVVQNRALREDDAAHSAQYCLDILRSLAVNPNPKLELRIFVNAWRAPGGPTLIVRTFDSCNLQAPPGS
jgi:hypothetical protein